jgi:hypothetical protein
MREREATGGMPGRGVSRKPHPECLQEAGCRRGVARSDAGPA